MAYRMRIHLESNKVEGKILLRSYSEYSEEEMVFRQIEDQVNPRISLDEMKYFEITPSDFEMMIDELRERLKTFDENTARDKKERDEVLQILSQDTLRRALTDKEHIGELADVFYECARRYCNDHDDFGSADFRKSIVNTIKEFEWYLAMLHDFDRPSDENVKLYCSIL